MAVQLKCGAIFLHVPKTGGSWVTSALRSQGLVDREFGHIHDTYDRARNFGGGFSTARHAMMTWIKSRIPRKFKSAGPIQKLKRSATSKSATNPFTFCFVRHPLDWYESFWRYMRQRGNDWIHEPDFQGWHPCKSLTRASSPDFNQFVSDVAELHPGFVTELFGSYTDPEIDFVGKQERLADDLVEVLTRLNVSFDETRLRETKEVNASPRSRQELTWDSDLRGEMLRIEYPAMLRFGYLQRQDTSSKMKARPSL